MGDVLDQSEIDRLLSAVDAGMVEEAPSHERIFSRHARDPESLDVRSYDFKRPERVSKDQMRALQTLHEGFARNFGASLSGFLRTIVEVKIAVCEQMTYSEFISGLPNPTSFNLIESSSLEGQMCLEMSPLIIYPIIDRLLGGSSHDLFIPQRPMTIIEGRLIGNVMKRGLAVLAEAWEGVRKMTFHVAATESNPQLVQIVPPNEVVVVIGFEIKLSNRAGTMNLCIPYKVIEPVVEKLSAQNWFSASRLTSSQTLRDSIAGRLGRAPVQVTGVLGETTITMRDLIDLSVGDVIIMDKPATEPVLVGVEGEPKFRALMGQHRGKRALRILSAVRDSERPFADAPSAPGPAPAPEKSAKPRDADG
ncbi:MAG: flagellar motor switch protein FliM [Phycisphaerales bacterium JB037]